MCADSRFTRVSGELITDEGVKLLHSAATPDIFGYCGAVDASTLVIKAAIQRIAETPDWIDISAEGRWEVIERKLRESVGENTARFFGRSYIVYGTRDRSSAFHLCSLRVDKWKTNLTLEARQYRVPTKAPWFYCWGEGSDAFQKRVQSWKKALGPYTRSFFGAFCDFLKLPGRPSSCGGAPQLLSLFRKGNPVEYGILFYGKAYVTGAEVQEPLNAKLTWRDETLQIIDPITRKLKINSQRQPRPRFPESYYT